MDGVSVASGIAGLITLAITVTGTLTEFVTAIRDKPKNVKELHDELLLLGEVLSQLRDFLAEEEAKGRSFSRNSVLQKAITDCYARIERIGDKLKPTEGGKIARALDRMKWPFEQKDVLQMVENLRRFTHTFQFAVTIEGCKILSKTSEDATKGLQEMLDVSKKINELSAQMGLSAAESTKRASQLQDILALLPLLTDTAEAVKELSNAARLAEIRDQERRTSEILDWLAPRATLHKHRDVQNKRAEGTGRWFLQHRDFVHWAENKTAEYDLLCTGAPGVGKTVLWFAIPSSVNRKILTSPNSSFVVDHLRRMYKESQVAVVHYYCDYAEQHEQTQVHVLRCLLRQVCNICNAIPAVVAEFYQQTRNNVDDQEWAYQLQSVLRRVIATFDRCFIIIDALDEAAPKHRAGLFDVLHNIRGSQSTVKVFASTRPHLANIEACLRDPKTVEVSAHESDLRYYLARTIDQHPDAEYTMDEELKKEILDTLCEKASGMFLLPALQIRNILDQVTKAEVRRALTTLSTDLTQVFQTTMQRIEALSATRRRLALDTLLWISHARRPLTVSELQHALAVRAEDTDLDLDNLPASRTVLDACCGLVEIDEESSIIRLVHFSLEEYLREADHGLFENGDLLITRTCLTYMTMDFVKPLPSANRAQFATAVSDFPLIKYACAEWGYHAKNVDVQLYKELALPFLSNSVSLVVAARARGFQNPAFQFRKYMDRIWAWAYSGGADISVAASFGAADLLRVLIARNARPMLSARNIYGSTPLQEVAMLGLVEVAEILVAHGADLLDKNKSEATAFFMAVSYDQLSMAKMLLGHNRAQLDLPCKNGFTALHKACDLGSKPMVLFLLQAGALVNARDASNNTPLHLAARRGHGEIVERLVLAGGLVDVQANDKLCALDHAVTGGHREIAEFLLENGGNLDHKSAEAWTPLHRAARRGHAKVIELLLSRGADASAEDSRGNIPLHLAVRSGVLDAVTTLLEHDSIQKERQLFHKDNQGSTPRVVAFFTAHYDLHKYLRAAEWAIFGNQQSPANELATAIEHGEVSRVSRLLDLDPARVEDLDEDGQPPLHIAIQEGQQECAKLLLERGAKIESAGFHKWRSLHIAASLGNLAMVRLCMEHGADVNAITSSGQTPLLKAASSRSLPVMRTLLEAGADASARNDRGLSALHVAAHQNDLEMVKLLVLEYNVDISVRDRFGATAALWAQRDGHLDMLSFLRNHERKHREKA